MEKVKLADGREINVTSFAVSSAGTMHIRVDMSLGEAAAAFSRGTEVIEYYPEDGSPLRISGWTRITHIVNEDDCVRVCLERPMDIEEINNG